MPRERRRSSSLRRGNAQQRVVRPRVTQPNDDNYCMNCRRTSHGNENNDITFSVCDIVVGTLKRKFCVIGSVYFNAHKDEDGILKARLCQECDRYMRKQTSLSVARVNEDWCIVWPAFIWSILASSTIHEKWGIKILCIVPCEWRIWWLPKFQKLFNNSYKLASLYWLKQVIRDLTARKEQYRKLVSELKLFDIEQQWDSILECPVSCPFGCCEFVHKTASLPLDIVIARALDLTDEDMLFVTKNPADVIEYRLKGIRNDYLTFPMKHDIFKLNNPNPDWEILPGLAFIEGKPMIQVCRDCGKGSQLHFLYPPRNPFPLVPCPPYGEQISPVAVRSTVLKTARASMYTDRHQMLHLQGHVNGVHTVRVTTDHSCIKENQLSVQYDSMALKGRDDIKAYFNVLIGKDNFGVTHEMGDFLMNRTEQMGDIERYKDYYESATYIAANIALKLEIEGKNRKKQCYSVFNGGAAVLEHLNSIWPRVIPYVHAFNTHGCKFPSLFYCGSVQNTRWEKILWAVTGIVAMVEPIWDALALKDVYDVNEIDGFFLSFASKVCFHHLCKKIPRKYPFTLKNGVEFGSEKSRILLGEKIVELGATAENCMSVLALVLKNAENVSVILMPEEEMDLQEQLRIAEVANKKCVVCYKSGYIEYDLDGTDWELRFVCGEVDGKQNIFVRHGGVLSGWWNVRCHSKFVTKIHDISDMLRVGMLANDIFLVYVRPMEMTWKKCVTVFCKVLVGKVTYIVAPMTCR